MRNSLEPAQRKVRPVADSLVGGATAQGIRFEVDRPDLYRPGQHLRVEVDGQAQRACVIAVEGSMVRVAWRSEPCEWHYPEETAAERPAATPGCPNEPGHETHSPPCGLASSAVPAQGGKVGEGLRAPQRGPGHRGRPAGQDGRIIIPKSVREYLGGAGLYAIVCDGDEARIYRCSVVKAASSGATEGAGP